MNEILLFLSSGTLPAVVGLAWWVDRRLTKIETSMKHLESWLEAVSKDNR